MQRKQGFTLVEMLIVVLIIGILAGAILPRITGYLAKTRDMKRQADLRNVAAAIERYKDEHGELPNKAARNSGEKAMGAISRLSEELSPYLTAIPKDPNSNSQIKLKQCFYNMRPWCSPLKVYMHIYKTGEYAYIPQYSKSGEKGGAGLLIAKVETPEAANYVYYGSDRNQIILNIDGHYRNHQRTIANYRFCNGITKVAAGNEFSADGREDRQCGYSSEDQLYYIVKIE